MIGAKTSVFNKNLIHAIGYFINKQEKLILYLFSVHWEAFPLELRYGLDSEYVLFTPCLKPLLDFFIEFILIFFNSRKESS